jgi:hypothetical protein
MTRLATPVEPHLSRAGFDLRLGSARVNHYRVRQLLRTIARVGSRVVRSEVCCAWGVNRHGW